MEGTGVNAKEISTSARKSITYDDDLETYTVPLKEPTYFGAGVKKQGIKFVPASASSPELATAPKPKNIGERYLEIVFGKKPASGTKQTTSATMPCDICRLPIDKSTAVIHESSLAHQVCLEHIYPPSAIDRTRKGVAYLQDLGWDPDSRKGLGASGNGILYPIQPKEKADKAGLGEKSRSTIPKAATPKVQKNLNAKEIRKLEAEKKRQHQRLHDMFYTDERVERYLGPGA